MKFEIRSTSGDLSDEMKKFDLEFVNNKYYIEISDLNVFLSLAKDSEIIIDNMEKYSNESPFYPSIEIYDAYRE